jgi:hypothetical protein
VQPSRPLRLGHVHRTARRLSATVLRLIRQGSTETAQRISGLPCASTRCLVHRWLDGKLIKTFPRRHADDVTRLSPDKKHRPRGKIALDVTDLPSLTSIPGRHFLPGGPGHRGRRVHRKNRAPDRLTRRSRHASRPGNRTTVTSPARRTTPSPVTPARPDPAIGVVERTGQVPIRTHGLLGDAHPRSRPTLGVSWPWPRSRPLRIPSTWTRASCWWRSVRSGGPSG